MVISIECEQHLLMETKLNISSPEMTFCLKHFIMHTQSSSWWLTYQVLSKYDAIFASYKLFKFHALKIEI